MFVLVNSIDYGWSKICLVEPVLFSQNWVLNGIRVEIVNLLYDGWVILMLVLQVNSHYALNESAKKVECVNIILEVSYIIFNDVFANLIYHAN